MYVLLYYVLLLFCQLCYFYTRNLLLYMHGQPHFNIYNYVSFTLNIFKNDIIVLSIVVSCLSISGSRPIYIHTHMDCIYTSSSNNNTERYANHYPLENKFLETINKK